MLGRRFRVLLLAGILASGCVIDPPEAFVNPCSTEVWEYLPAPGQFIGDKLDASSMDEACQLAGRRLADHLFVSLGAFGGYIVVGFDHPISNSGDYDIAVMGNSSEASSEPGTVWVMEDSNRNGKPDDVWYRLKGSADDDPSTLKGLSVTYYRPDGPGKAVRWSASDGTEGFVPYLGEYHPQDSYYPRWVKEDSYTLTGLCLAPRNYDSSGNGTMWINPSYGTGYADNWSAEMDGRNNLFRISDAVDDEGKPVNLDHADFVKVQTAVNTHSGWLGEASTEVLSIADYHLL